MSPPPRNNPNRLLTTHPRRQRSAGLYRAKVLALKDLAAKTLEKVVPPLRILRAMPDEEIIARLTADRGGGRWTAEMLPIFRPGLPDGWPPPGSSWRQRDTPASRPGPLS